MAKILFIAAHRPDRSPSQRFRFEQYFDFLKKNGFECDFSYLISEKDDKVFYQPGNLHTKFYIFIKSALKRWKDVLNAGDYDIIFVQREAFMTGSTFFERQFHKKHKAKLVFDFDDAIWMLDMSDANKRFGWLKKPEKTAELITLSDMIFAGNRYLANYAERFNKNVRIIPTTIDMNEYQRFAANDREDDKICIGWSGSLTTIKHFEYAVPILQEVRKKYGDRIRIKVIGDGSYVHEELEIKGIAWNKKDEIKELSSFDIGIMPLPDDEWAKGKCGLKGLQYMALEIPTIMSPVGVNSEIIQDGINGFLASGMQSWIEKIAQLIESKELREKIGKKARETVLEKYSVYAQQENYLRLFKELLGH